MTRVCREKFNYKNHIFSAYNGYKIIKNNNKYYVIFDNEQIEIGNCTVSIYFYTLEESRLLKINNIIK